MSSREEPNVWRPGAEPASASGGHVAPEIQTEALYDPLTAPLPSERERQDWEASRTPRTDVIPREDHAPAPRSRSRRGRMGIRRVKRTLRHVDPLSVLKISLFFYAVFLVLWLGFVAIMYGFAEGANLFSRINEIQEGLAVDKTDFSLWTVERWAFLIGLTFVVIASIINVFLSFLYNVAADLLGGVEMTFVERDG